MQPSSTYTVAAGTSYCDGKHAPLYATSIGTSLDVTPQMPCIGQLSTLNPTCTGTESGTWDTLTAAYNAQKALSKTGCPANLLDNDTTLNNSDTSISSAMFGGTAYDCKIGSANEIKYTPTSACGTGTLFVKGTIYFDGSLSMGCGLKVVYSGQATLYFTGRSARRAARSCAESRLHGVVEPERERDHLHRRLLEQHHRQRARDEQLRPDRRRFDGAVGRVRDDAVPIAGGSSNMGPVLANTMSIGGGASSLIPFSVMPPGTPLNSTSHYVPASPPTSWSG